MTQNVSVMFCVERDTCRGPIWCKRRRTELGREFGTVQTRLTDLMVTQEVDDASSRLFCLRSERVPEFGDGNEGGSAVDQVYVRRSRARKEKGAVSLARSECSWFGGNRD
jgi:hypothetical protein